MRSDQLSAALRPHARRGAALLAIPLTIAAGLLSRRWLAGLAAKLAGDALYTVLVFVIVLALAPACRPRRAAAIALGVSFAVELFQLTPYPAWLAAQHVIFRLIFGTTFGLVDLAGYVLGAGVAVIAHALVSALVSRGAPAP
jgi:hypothetical protein